MEILLTILLFVGFIAFAGTITGIFIFLITSNKEEDIHHNDSITQNH
ncbi:hypothetical protein [Dysgonomonas sp. 511]|nr:hypothetical protein [Dysgonomonas sp. 511]